MKKVLTADAMPGYEVDATVPAPVVKKTRKKAKVAKAVTATADVKRWATFGVLFTLVLSAGLNGYANAQHSPIALLGWMMGVSIPVLVLVLAKVCGEKHRMGQRPVAYLAGGSGIALLLLSVWHCANSIAMITGSELFLAVPLALAIDCGLIACEVALITEPRAKSVV